MNTLETTHLLTQIISPVEKNTQEIEKQLTAFDESEWEKLIELANREALIPLLYKSLQRKNLLTLIDDEQLLGYLEAFYKLNEERNIAIVTQLEEISSLFTKADIEHTLLKGATALSESHYENIGERVMIDIDISVEYDKAMQAVEILKKCGYKETDPDTPLEVEWHHYRRLYRDDIVAAVEVHRIFVSYRVSKFLPDECPENYKQSHKFLNARILVPTYDLYHSFLHTQVSHRYHTYKHLSIRHMQHFCVIATKYDIDFKYLETLVKEKGLEDIWQEYLLVQHKFFNLQVDEKILKNKKAQNYLYAIEKKILAKKSLWIKVKTFWKKSFYALGYINLRKHYKFEKKYMMFFYIPLRVITLLYLYGVNPTKRSKLYSEVDELAS